VNNLQSLVGDVVRVQAATSNATRGFEVEDTAAMVFTFASGALGTFLLSDDRRLAPLLGADVDGRTTYTSYPDEDCYHLAGTQGSLSVPTMRLKVYRASARGGSRSSRPPSSSSAATRWPTRSNTSPL
jgi:predicted dehydrogenase